FCHAGGSGATTRQDRWPFGRVKGEAENRVYSGPGQDAVEVGEQPVGAVPVEQRLGIGAHRDAVYPADQDGMRVPLDRLIELAVDGGERATEAEGAGGLLLPLRTFVARRPPGAATAGEAVRDMRLVVGEQVDAEAAMALERRP